LFNLLRAGSVFCAVTWQFGHKRSRRFIVVPAKAGTHTPRPVLLEKKDNDQRAKQFPLVVMGPGLRRDDGKYYSVSTAAGASGIGQV
jgi:hypothetical protein